MIHEGPLLEYAGRDLACLQWAAAARHWIVLVLAAQVFLPHAHGIWAQLGVLPGRRWSSCAPHLHSPRRSSRRCESCSRRDCSRVGALTALLGVASWLVQIA